MTDCTTSPSHLPALRVRGPADLVDLVPYLLGFRPTDSVVLVGLGGTPDTTISVTVRVDADAALDAATRADCVAALRSSGAHSAVLLVYPGAGAGDRCDTDVALSAAVAAACAEHGLRLMDALWVTGGRWRSYCCPDPGCCPPEGRRTGDARGPTPLMVAATVAGLSALPDRASLAESLRPLPESIGRPVRRALARLVDSAVNPDLDPTGRGIGGPNQRADADRAKRVWTAQASACRRARHRVPPHYAAELLAAIGSIVVRDWCCEWADGPHAARAEALSLQLARIAGPSYDARAYTLVAWFGWRRGDGATARIAAEYALESDPDQRLASLVVLALDRAVDPRRWGQVGDVDDAE